MQIFSGTGRCLAYWQGSRMQAAANVQNTKYFNIHDQIGLLHFVINISLPSIARFGDAFILD